MASPSLPPGVKPYVAPQLKAYGMSDFGGYKSSDLLENGGNVQLNNPVSKEEMAAHPGYALYRLTNNNTLTRPAYDYYKSMGVPHASALGGMTNWVTGEYHGPGGTPNPARTPELTTSIRGGASPTGLINQPTAGPGAPVRITDGASITSGPTQANFGNTAANGVNKWNVTPDQTVQGQVSNITASDSPLMQQAAAGATQAMNARGLLNSNLAIGAGQGAVLSAATPIAQQDASTNANAAQFNASEQNKALTQATDFANQKVLTQLSADNQYKLQQLTNTNSQILQSGSWLNTLYNNGLSEIANIQASDTMLEPAKTAAINNILEYLRQSAGSVTAGLDPSVIKDLNVGQYFQTGA